jgi:hypothetical protein
MSTTKLAVVFAFLLAAPLSGTEIDDGESSERVILEASLSGPADDPILSIRLQNSGKVPIIVDKELVFLPAIFMSDSEKRNIGFTEISDIDRPSPSDLGSRLISLNPGEEIKRDLHLRKGFKQFVTGIGEPSLPNGREAPKVTAYECLSLMPVNAHPVEITVEYDPPYSFKEGFAKYMRGVEIGRFYRGPLSVSVSYPPGSDSHRRAEVTTPSKSAPSKGN